MRGVFFRQNRTDFAVRVNDALAGTGVQPVFRVVRLHQLLVGVEEDADLAVAAHHPGADFMKHFWAKFTEKNLCVNYKFT
jgi:hypothetical protein